jgi:hypothetical protein
MRWRDLPSSRDPGFALDGTLEVSSVGKGKEFYQASQVHLNIWLAKGSLWERLLAIYPQVLFLL